MQRYEVVGVLALAAALRLLLFFLWAPPLVADAWDYDRLARSLVEGRGYTNTRGELTSFRPPLYPAFVAAVYALTRKSLDAVVLVQILLDLGTVALTYIAARWLFGHGAGLVAALLISVNLATIAMTMWIASETLFTILLMAGVVLSLAWLDRLRRGDVPGAVAFGITVGLVLGAATLARGVVLLYPLALIVLTTIGLRLSKSPPGGAPKRQRAILAGCLSVALAFCLILTPWTIRNYRVHAAFVPVATQGGQNLYESYNPRDGWKYGFIPQDEVVAEGSRLPEQAANVFFARAAIQSIRASPVKTLKLELLKIVYFWAPVDWEILPFYGVFNPTYAFIALWAVLYLACSLRRPSSLTTAVFVLPVWYLFVMALVFQGNPRYRLPAEPLLAVFAAAQIMSLDWRSDRRRPVFMVGATVGFLVLACAFAGPLKEFAKRLIIRAV
jgi:4-amino-4-deoxy-L-arabinose transferase-like glycosyltransferase